MIKFSKKLQCNSFIPSPDINKRFPEARWFLPGLIHFKLFDQSLISLWLIFLAGGKFLYGEGLSSSSHGHHVGDIRGSKSCTCREPTFVSRVGGEGGGTGDHTLVVVVVVDGVWRDEVVEAVVVSGVVEHVVVVVVAGAGVWESLGVYSRGKEVAHFIFDNQT